MCEEECSFEDNKICDSKETDKENGDLKPERAKSVTNPDKKDCVNIEENTSKDG